MNKKAREFQQRINASHRSDTAAEGYEHAIKADYDISPPDTPAQDAPPELKRCPFDGSGVKIVPKDAAGRILRIWCPVCHISIGETTDAKALAQEWNARADDAEIERLKAALRDVGIEVIGKSGQTVCFCRAPTHKCKGEPQCVAARAALSGKEKD